MSKLLPETSFEEEILVNDCVKYHFINILIRISFLRTVLTHKTII